jgi:hypothetical protein
VCVCVSAVQLANGQQILLLLEEDNQNRILARRSTKERLKLLGRRASGIFMSLCLQVSDAAAEDDVPTPATRATTTTTTTTITTTTTTTTATATTTTLTSTSCLNTSM